MKKKPIQYVDNKAFYDAIVEYRKEVALVESEGLEPPRMPNYIGECILKIAQKLSLLPKFINYSFRDEMISDAVENMILYFHDYNPEYVNEENPNYKPNPFAYFTQIAFYAFIRRIGNEEKIRYGSYKNFYYNVIHATDTDLSSFSSFDDGDKPIMTTQMYNNIADFIERFETKVNKKKEQRVIKKVGLEKFYE